MRYGTGMNQDHLFLLGFTWLVAASALAILLLAPDS
jgi:hypothetical protein